MFAKLLLGLALLSPTAALAQWSDCPSHDRDPWGCAQDINCQYDNVYNRCDDRVGGGGNRACSSYDADPYLCSQQGCWYDQRLRRCEDNNNGPYPQPNGCWEFNNDPFRCGQTPNCYYDSRSRACLDYNQPGPGPGPGPSNGLWECTAKDTGWEEHPGGHSAQGYGYNQAQNAAISFCERYHDTCVISSCRQLR